MLRRQKSTKKLSADELKSKLYAHFDKSGSLNQLRTQLRSQLVSELFKIAPPPSNYDSSGTTIPNLDKTLLPLQVCHWLINDHLYRQGYQYTLSTFVSETNMPYLEKLLTAGDILGLFGLDNSTPEYRKISEMYVNKDEKGILNSLLLAIIKSLFDISSKETEKEEKQKSDMKENDIAISSYPNSSNQECVLDTRKPDVANASSRSYYTNMPEPHKLNLQEQIQFIKEEKNREIKNLRHKLLEELERLHSQERYMHQELEQEKKEIRKDRDLLVSEKEQIKEKETLFRKEQENKYEKKVREIEESYAVKLHSKDKELEFLHKKIGDRESKLGQMEFDLSSHQERYENLKRELNDVNQMYKSVHEKYNSLLDENTNLVRKFENMSDYNVIKEELAVKSKEIVILQHGIEKVRNNAEKDRKAYMETVTSLELKLKSTEPKLHQMQRELNQTRDTLHMEEVVWNKEKLKLEQESVTTKELYKTVLQRIEEQKQDIQDLHQTIHILHYQLTNKDTNYSAKTEPPLFTKSVPKATSFSVNDSAGKSFKNNPVYLSQRYRENALNFTSDYKNRLNKLQQEIEASYDKYSLIYCSSLDGKFPTTKIPSKGNTSLFKYNVKLDSPLLPKNLANKSSDLFSGLSKQLMPSLKKFVPSFDTHKTGGINTEVLNKRTEESLNQNSDAPAHSFLNQTKAHFSDNTNKDNILKFNKSSNPYSINSLEEQSFSLVSNKDDMLSLSKNSLLQSNQIALNKEESDKTLLNKTNENFSPHIPDSNSLIEHNNSSDFSNNAPALKKSSFPQISDFSKVDSSLQEKQIKSSNTNSSITESSQRRSDEILTFDFKSNEEPITEFSNVNPIASSEAKQSSMTINNRNTLIGAVKSSTETTPIVVDLDAAWKRKTSLPSASVPDIHNSSLLKTNEVENKNIFPKKENIDSKLLVPTVVSSIIGESNDHTNILQNTAIPENSSVVISELSSILHVDDDKNTSSKPSANDTLINVENDLKTNNLLQLESITENKSVSEDMSGTDYEAKRNPNSDVKHVPEDSLSELSEVHLSCGSGQEEQKEQESDNW